MKETGRSYENERAMVWTLRDGKVAAGHIDEDTARELAAHAAESTRSPPLFPVLSSVTDSG